MSVQENYEQFCSVMDIDSLIDWLIMEGYCGNSDLRGGNVRYCRSTENDGKWKVVFYDLDSTLLRRFRSFYNLLDAAEVGGQQISQIILPLLKNEDFVDRLLTRFAAAINGPLSNENVLSEIDKLVTQVEPETGRDFARWSMSSDSWLWNVEYLRNFIGDEDYQQNCIDALCDILKLSDAQREYYFESK